MKNKCKESAWDDWKEKYVRCNQKPVVCEEHHNELYKKYYTTKNKLTNRNYTISLIIGLFLLTISTIWFFSIPKINEDKFCLDKLNKYFPEYKFESAKLYTSTKCNGYYTSNVTIRDGLSEVGKLEQKNFKLINKEDINYLGKDDIQGVPFFLFYISVMIIVFTIYLWKDEW